MRTALAAILFLWLAAVTAQAGPVCGDDSIDGQAIAPVRGVLPGCFILNPVRVRAVAGVQLSVPVIVDCPTARALAEWVRTGVAPVFGQIGRGVAVLEVAGSYACRTQNAQTGAPLSEHGRGRAVDISGFRTFDGQRVDVGRDWRRPGPGGLLRRVHALACGPFSTVLGPDADIYHAGHLHLDTGNHAGGQICK